MKRKYLAVAGLISAFALFASACTIPAPAERTWKVRPVSVQVLDQEDPDAGDEPYVIQLGFRSKLGVEGSSSASVVSQCEAGAIPVGPLFAQALEDALSAFAVEITEIPLSPNKLFALIHGDEDATGTDA